MTPGTPGHTSVRVGGVTGRENTESKPLPVVIRNETGTIRSKPLRAACVAVQGVACICCVGEAMFRGVLFTGGGRDVVMGI